MKQCSGRSRTERSSPLSGSEFRVHAAVVASFSERAEHTAYPWAKASGWLPRKRGTQTAQQGAKTPRRSQHPSIPASQHFEP